jgi:hypothetical protein
LESIFPTVFLAARVGDARKVSTDKAFARIPKNFPKTNSLPAGATTASLKNSVAHDARESQCA